MVTHSPPKDSSPAQITNRSRISWIMARLVHPLESSRTPVRTTCSQGLTIHKNHR